MIRLIQEKGPLDADEAVLHNGLRTFMFNVDQVDYRSRPKCRSWTFMQYGVDLLKAPTLMA